MKRYKSPITGEVVCGEDNYGVNWLEVLEPNLLNAAHWALENEYHPKCLTKIELANSLLNYDDYAQQMLISYWSYISDPWGKPESKTECNDEFKACKSLELNGDVLSVSSGNYKKLEVDCNVVTFNNVVILREFTLNCNVASGNVKLTHKTKCIINCNVNNLRITYVNEEEL